MKKLTIGLSLVVLLAMAAAPVQAAIKVSNSYYSSGSNGSIISLRSYLPTTTPTTPSTPSTPATPSTPVNTNPVNTSSGYGSVISLKNFKFLYPSTPAPAPTQPTPTQPAPTQPAPTQPAPTQPAPTQPAPTQPAPTQPAPTQPAPTQPAPTQPTTPPTSGTTTVSTQEQAMINEINKERAAAGLAPVKVDLRLVEVAQLKAMDMKTNGYFSHTSPTYGSPFDMLRNAGIQYRSAGENIARNMSVDAAMAAFMSSDGHRKNILNPAYTHVGVGVVSSSSGNYYVQIFAQL